MAGLLDHGFQFLAGVKSDNPARADRDFLPRFRIAAWALRLVAQLEVAEARKLHPFAPLERSANLLEERFHHVLRFALVEPDLLEKEVRQLGLRQRHHFSPNSLYLRRLAENS